MLYNNINNDITGIFSIFIFSFTGFARVASCSVFISFAWWVCDTLTLNDYSCLRQACEFIFLQISHFHHNISLNFTTEGLSSLDTDHLFVSEKYSYYSRQHYVHTFHLNAGLLSLWLLYNGSYRFLSLVFIQWIVWASFALNNELWRCTADYIHVAYLQ